MTCLTPIQEAMILQTVMKAVQVGFAVITETKMCDLFELNVRMHDMQLEMRHLGERVQNNEDKIKYNSAKLDAQQMSLALRAMDEAEKQLKLVGLGDTFSKLTDRTAQRVAVTNWIHTYLDISLSQFGGVGIQPIVPKNSPSFVILNFLSTNDARHFESIVFKKRNNKEIPDEVKTQRWTVNSLELGGDEETYQYIQQAIVNSYNEHCEEAGMDKYQLQQHHIGMIRITPTKRFIKGKPHILMDFLDPCDRITSMLWYSGIDPFKDYDFSFDIPNPRTRRKALENPAYAEYTIGVKGLWNAKARSKW